MMMSDMWAGVAVIVIGEVSTEGGRSLLKGDCNFTEATSKASSFFSKPCTKSRGANRTGHTEATFIAVRKIHYKRRMSLM